MSPEDRATKIVNTFYIKLHESKGYYDIENAKNCALICADEFLEYISSDWVNNIKYWEDVKIEIQNIEF